MFHEFNDTEVANKLEEAGYGNLRPAISPEALRALCEDDPLLTRCLESMFKYVNRYAHDVYEMLLQQMELSEKREKNEDTKEDFEELKRTDERRHNLHEALMSSIDLVSRELGKRGKNNEWMREFVHEGRAGYARFALLTFYRLHVKMK